MARVTDSGPVMAKIECTEQVHAMLKQHCKEHKIRIKEFVSTLVLRELSPVEVKPIELNRAGLPADDAWSKPPFWAKE